MDYRGAHIQKVSSHMANVLKSNFPTEHPDFHVLTADLLLKTTRFGLLLDPHKKVNQ